MSNNANNALTIPDPEQLEQDVALFATTRQWLDHAGGIASGTTEGDLMQSLAVVYSNVAALEQSHLLAHAAIAGLKEAADLLRQQRDAAITEVDEIREEVNELEGVVGKLQTQVNDTLEYIDAAHGEGYQLGIDEALDGLQFDPDDLWGELQAYQKDEVARIAGDLDLLGEAEGATQLREQFKAAVETYEEAARLIEQYGRHTSANWKQLNELHQQRWAAQHAPLPVDDDNGEADDDEAETEAF